jgi:dimethylargininase
VNFRTNGQNRIAYTRPVDEPAAPTRYGAESMVDPLREALVKRPGDAFGGAFDDPTHGFLHRVDLPQARRQHDELCSVIAGLGVTVHELGVETDSPDLVYTFDPALVTGEGAIVLRPGKTSRVGEEAALEKWFVDHGVPVAGRIEAPGTVEGGDTFWLAPSVFCVGRSLRTNRSGAEQLVSLAGTGGEVHVFDVPYARGPGECLHLLSVISPVSEAAAAVFLPLLPSGLYELLGDHGFDLIPVPEEEFPTLGCNILAVRPGVVVMAEGNPITERALIRRGCEVHTFPASEIGINGGGGPTCLTRPILRQRG